MKFCLFSVETMGKIGVPWISPRRTSQRSLNPVPVTPLFQGVQIAAVQFERIPILNNGSWTD